MVDFIDYSRIIECPFTVYGLGLSYKLFEALPLIVCTVTTIVTFEVIGRCSLKVLPTDCVKDGYLSLGVDENHFVILVPPFVYSSCFVSKLFTCFLGTSATLLFSTTLHMTTSARCSLRHWALVILTAKLTDPPQ